jgi:hypothetical protein
MAQPVQPETKLSSRLKKGVTIAASVGVFAYAAAFGFFDVAMHQSPEYFSTVMKYVGPVPFLIFPFETMWKNAREGELKAGNLAPDFKLEVLGGSGLVQLSSFRGNRPVVLIFGSYTWPPFRREVPALNKLHDRYKDLAAFYVVYITEAHSTDMWQMASNVRDGVLFANPTTVAGRQEVAGACVRNLHISIPALIDSLDNTVERNYTAWPDRLFLIGKDGVVRWKSGAGPFGFSAKGLETALQDLPK